MFYSSTLIFFFFFFFNAYIYIYCLANYYVGLRLCLPLLLLPSIVYYLLLSFGIGFIEVITHIFIVVYATNNNNNKRGTMVDNTSVYCRGALRESEDALCHGAEDTCEFCMPVEFLDDTSFFFLPPQEQQYFFQSHGTKHAYPGSIGFKDTRILLLLSLNLNDISKTALTSGKLASREVPVLCDVAESVTKFCRYTSSTLSGRTLCYLLEFMGGAQNVIFRFLTKQAVKSKDLKSNSNDAAAEEMFLQWAHRVEKFTGTNMETCVFGSAGGGDAVHCMSRCFYTFPWGRLQRAAADVTFATREQKYQNEQLIACMQPTRGAPLSLADVGLCEESTRDEVAQLLLEEEKLARLKLEKYAASKLKASPDYNANALHVV